jgi:hypothetical protein
LTHNPCTFSRRPLLGLSNSTRDREHEVTMLSLIPVHDPVAVVEHEELSAPRKNAAHLEDPTLLVLSADDREQVEVERGVHGTECGGGKVKDARVPKDTMREQVDASPAGRRRTTENLERRLL